jgi:hypothetical protein
MMSGGITRCPDAPWLGWHYLRGLGFINCRCHCPSGAFTARGWVSTLRISPLVGHFTWLFPARLESKSESRGRQRMEVGELSRFPHPQHPPTNSRTHGAVYMWRNAQRVTDYATIPFFQAQRQSHLASSVVEVILFTLVAHLQRPPLNRCGRLGHRQQQQGGGGNITTTGQRTTHKPTEWGRGEETCVSAL